MHEIMNSLFFQNNILKIRGTMRYIFSFIVLIVALLIPYYSYGQMPSTLLGDQELSELGIAVSFSPQHPKAHEEVTATLRGTRFDLSTATISWFVDDELESFGVAQRSFVFGTGAAGSQSRIRFVVETPSGFQITREVAIRPTTILLHWEADTYTPKLYRGRAGVTAGASVRVVALPDFIRTDGTSIDPDLLIYQWKSGQRNLTEHSGLGRRTITIPVHNSVREGTVSVEISSQDGLLRGFQEITIPVVDPFVRIYTYSPLRGIVYNTSVSGAFSMTQDEMALIAEPFFFSVNSREANLLSYVWNVNRQQVQARSLITLRREEENSFQSMLNLEVRHTDHIMQRALSEQIRVSQ